MMQLKKLETHGLSATIATINYNRDKRLRGDEWHFRYEKNMATVEEAIHFLQALYHSEASQESILSIGLSGTLPDLPAIYWCELLKGCGYRDELYTKCYAKANGDSFSLMTNVLGNDQEQQTLQQLCEGIEKHAQATYLSATILDNDNAYQHILFKIERSGQYYRITEFATNRKMPNYCRFAVQKVYYAKSMASLTQAVDIILTESISLSEFIQGKKPTQAVDAIRLDFLDDVSFYQHSALTKAVSGLLVAGLAKSLFPLSLLKSVVDQFGASDVLSSDAYCRENQLMRLLSQVRLDACSAPDVRCNETDVTLFPREVLSTIDPAVVAKYPIVQGIDPRMPHDTFHQPYEVVGITHGSYFRDMCEEDIYRVVDKINGLLQDQEAREQQESEYYSYTTITADNLPLLSGHSLGTIGIKGVVAKKDIPQYTPVLFKQQYAEQDSLEQSAMIMAMKNHTEYGLNMYRKVTDNQATHFLSTEDSVTEAYRLRNSYSWDILPCEVYSPRDGLKTRKLWTNAWGAGGVANGLNADFSEGRVFVNHASITCKTIDKEGNLAPPLVVYFSLSDIAQGQELLVDYGPFYTLSESLEGNVMTVSK